MRAYDPLTLLLSDSSLRKFLFVNVTSKMCEARVSFCVNVLCALRMYTMAFFHSRLMLLLLLLFVCVRASVIPILLGFQ